MIRKPTSTGRQNQGGQALALMTLAMVAALAMVALIVDGGYAFAQLRITQNGADAAADAGATVLGERLSATSVPINGTCPGLTGGPYWDCRVDLAVNGNAAANGIQLDVAYYTDICGTVLDWDGSKATAPAGDPNPSPLHDPNVAIVGDGFPGGNAGPPTCGQPVVGPVAGVMAFASHTFRTFVAPIIHITQLATSANATAVAGWLQSCARCMLPIAFPVKAVVCDNSGKAEQVIDDDPSSPGYGTWQDWPKNVPHTVVPICKVAPGNVGFLNWDPNGSGTNDLTECATNPCNTPFSLPAWITHADSGNRSSTNLEAALNSHIGDTVLLPLFDYMCRLDPDPAQVNIPAQYGCGDPDLSYPGQLNNGVNPNWYRVKLVGAFVLEHAYVNGNNTDECLSPGNVQDPDFKTKECLIGEFVDFITTGDIGVSGGTESTGAVGIQLIK